ncbi:TPA: hypothetical protein I9232_006067 [Klebsiella oxytoca]|uniref:hypothetical protein n=1 Tax=Klebsiella pneumoniae TaxID=573 RepID=UPI001A2CEE94|nr:hypothetical protein [Klebsiella oxytoca]
MIHFSRRTPSVSKTAVLTNEHAGSFPDEPADVMKMRQGLNKSRVFKNSPDMIVSGEAPDGHNHIGDG